MDDFQTEAMRTFRHCHQKVMQSAGRIADAMSDIDPLYSSITESEMDAVAASLEGAARILRDRVAVIRAMPAKEPKS